MHVQPLVELTRGGHLECQHFGAIAVVNATGQVTARVGNPEFVTFTRSTLKALQALPFVQANGPQQLGYTQAEVALLCASHSGEAMHVQAAQSMLEKAGTTYRRLRCGCHVPYHFDLSGTPVPAGATFDERHNNCSGKHSGFLGYCAIQGLPDDNYLAPDHPLQQAIRRDVARAVGMAPEDMRMGIDGCSAPNYAMPLSRLATGYARLASGQADGEYGASFALLGAAMSSHPEMVSGSLRSDAAFMRAGGGDWVTKVGADGVQVVGSKSRREAFAIKISDGNKPALFAATVEVLEQLGWLNDTQRALLAPWRAQTLSNVRGVHVGERIPVFKLQAS